MSLSNNFPTIAPSLLLDFANVKALDPRITFVRTTTGVFYDGKTTAKAEENLFLQSQDFTTSWVNVRSTDTANTEVAPDGTTTADSVLQAAGETSAGLVQQLNIPTSAGDVVMSVFAKPNGKNWVVFREDFTTGSTKSTWFDVQNGTVGTTAAEHTASIVASTNGFYRCIIKSTANASRSTTVRYSLADTDGSTVVADDGNGLYLWGAQLEQRSAVSAYTPTTTQPITNYIPVLQTAASGVARFDHNPTTGESLGLLVEEQRTNLLLRSEEFDNASWTTSDLTVSANTVVAPSGALTGDKLVSSGSGSPLFQGLTQTVSALAAAGQFSVYLKAAEITQAELRSFGATTDIAIVDLSTQTFVSGTGTIQSVGNDWYRVAVSATTGNTGFRISLVKNGNRSFAADGYSGIYIWGAQLEAGAFPTSYIATTSASVTRNADAASMTGTNFSSWYRADEGTVYSESVVGRQVAIASTGIYQIDDTTTSNRLFTVYRASGATGSLVSVGGVSQADLSPTGVLSANQTFKNCFAYKVNDFAACGNGGTVQTDTSGTIPVVSQMLIGNSVAVINGTIRKLAFYPSRLTNAQLQALTS